MTSYLGDNIIVVIIHRILSISSIDRYLIVFQIVFQISGSFGAPILGVFLLGFFAPRVNSRVNSEIIMLMSMMTSSLPLVEYSLCSDHLFNDSSLDIDWCHFNSDTTCRKSWTITNIRSRMFTMVEY